MNRRLQRVFHDDDGLRHVLVTGPAAGDLVFVDIAIGAIPIHDAILERATRDGFDVAIEVRASGEIRFPTPEMKVRFDQATAAVSRDPTRTSATSRQLGDSSPHRPAPAGHDAAGGDALLAAIGRIERAQSRTDVRILVHFVDLGAMLDAHRIASDRVRTVFNSIGRLMAAGVGRPDSRIVVTMGASVLDQARSLLSHHDHGATAWHVANIDCPDEAEILGFLDRAQGRHGLVGSARATAASLYQRRYSLARISEALRRRVLDKDLDLASIVGGEIDNVAMTHAQVRLDALVGLGEFKSLIRTLIDEASRIQEAIRSGQRAEPPLTHFALLGRPGTGKTEVVGIVKDLLHSAGIRRNDVLVTATIGDIVGAYNSGEAIQNMRDLVSRAAGGVLFLDEAYSLAENEWAQQALAELIAAMESRRGDLTVVLAGYPDRMQALFQANEGLRSRLFTIFRLEDYTPTELCEIFDRRLAQSSIEVAAPAREAAHAIIRRESTRVHANARDVRSRFEQWNRARLASGSTTLEASHIVDPRAHSAEAAELLIAEYAQAFVDLPEPVAWMRRTLATSLDAFRSGRLHPAPRLALVGPQGTGKTETARRLGGFLRACGVLNDGRVLARSLKDFSSSFAGGAAERTQRQLRDAAECVLFIDEIYMFAQSEQGRGVLDQLVAALTDPEYSNVAVVFAGYEDRMQDVYAVNPGLMDRLEATIRLGWPSDERMAAIAARHLGDVLKKPIAPSGERAVRLGIAALLAERRLQPDFAGVRSALRLARDIHANAAARGSPEVDLQDLPKRTPSPTISVIVADFRHRFPDSDFLVPALQEIVAKATLMRIGKSSSTSALGICLVGPPGCGKSTFARWTAEQLSQQRDGAVLPYVERSALSLQGTHLGQAQDNVRRLFGDARGGCLFLDEFHALRTDTDRPSLYSTEIAKELVAQMTSPANARTIVFLAGYPGEMRMALQLDPGLASRFPHLIELQGPSDAVLASTTFRMLEQLYGGVEDMTLETLSTVLERHFARKRAERGKDFGAFRCATDLANTIGSRALVRADGDAKALSITIEDVLEAART